MRVGAGNSKALIASVLLVVSLSACASLNSSLLNSGVSSNSADTGLRQSAPPEDATQSEDLVPTTVQGFYIKLPFEGAGVTTKAAIREARYQMIACRRDAYARLLINRRVNVVVPASYDLFDQTLVNSLLIGGVFYALNNCPQADAMFKLRSHFVSGVQVDLSQNGEVVVAARGFDERKGKLEFIGVQHLALERKMEIEAAERKRRESEEFWASFRFYVYCLFGLIAAIFTAPYLPRIIGYILYFFNPHPARALVNRSTQGPHSKPLDGGLLRKALDHRPITKTTLELAHNDVKRMQEREIRETEYLADSEKLARLSINMELQRARTQELKKHGGRK